MTDQLDFSHKPTLHGDCVERPMSQSRQPTGLRSVGGTIPVSDQNRMVLTLSPVRRARPCAVGLS